jgi:hypothetical protein
MLDQTEQYIAKALMEEAKGENNFLTENELAFRVTGMMYADSIKSDGPVSLRSVKGKMNRVRSICDENSKILLPLIEDGEEGKEIKGWKIASPADLDYIGEVFLGIKPAEKKTADAPEAEASE